MAIVLFDVAHPKHFYQFRSAWIDLSSDHQIHVIAREKDVLLGLLRDAGVEHRVYGRNRRGLGGKFIETPRSLLGYARELGRIRPDLIVSKSSPYAATLARLFRARTMVMPDSEGVALNERYVIPRSDFVVTPTSYSRDYGSKHRRVSGFFEAGYLHPRHFIADPTAIESLGIQPGERFAVIRFVAWGANHDVGKVGITDDQKIELVRALREQVRVVVSAEGAVPDELRPLIMKLPPSRIHHLLHFASLYVGDSQTMATEAALLGTPAIRCNSFVGASDFSNFGILERDHQLLSNFSSFADAKRRALEILAMPDSKAVWEDRRRRFFDQVGDVNAEIARTIRDALR
jgi:predicted glycosyltransferase